MTSFFYAFEYRSWCVALVSAHAQPMFPSSDHWHHGGGATHLACVEVRITFRVTAVEYA